MNQLLIILLSGLGIGLLGSFHCVGMCGPLALALPVHTLGRFGKIMAVINYNLGRTLTYGMLGLLLGSIGPMFKIQQWLSVSGGIIILLLVLSNSLSGRNNSFISKLTKPVKKQLGRFLNSAKQPSAYITVGILNGLLPCGLVYMALVSAIATGSMLHSGLLMTGFGLGTLPLMALLMAGAQYISPLWRVYINKATPYIIGCVGLLLILRGLNLGIPYLSPAAGGMNCCH